MPEPSDKAALLLYGIVRAAATGDPPPPWTGPWGALSEEDRDAFRKVAQLIAETHAEQTEAEDA